MTRWLSDGCISCSSLGPNVALDAFLTHPTAPSMECASILLPVRRILAMPELHRPEPRRLALIAVVVVAALVTATIAVAVLEGPQISIADASPVYLIAVVLVGSSLGTWPALATAVLSFLVYDILFTEPRLSLVVTDPREWLDLVVFLVLAIVVGRLSALGSERAVEATRRAAESSALFGISRTLATALDVDVAAAEIAARLVRESGLERVWIAIEQPGRTRIVADSAPDEPLPRSAFTTSLVRTPGDSPARWVRSHEKAVGASSTTDGGASADTRPEILRVRMEADGALIGYVRATRRRSSANPSRGVGRLLALAADQLALAIRREELRREATKAEIARQADALKSALLDAVSHDLRTPLASIRATAGSLTDREVPLDVETARLAGAAIDLEAQRLDRLVRAVLDLGRIEAGALRPDVEALDLRDVVEPAVDRLRPMLEDREIRIDLPEDLPPVRADAVLLDTVIGNLLENSGRHAPPPAVLAISARNEGDQIRLVVEDGGPGVPDGALAQLFDKFYRTERRTQGARPGLGVGLAIVRGFAEAMAGGVAADRSPLGGLRVSVTLPVAAAPPIDVADATDQAHAADAAHGARGSSPGSIEPAARAR
jgi:two-component system sensor histidine kinase KdpD